MHVNKDALSVINAFPDAVLVLSQERGRIVEANDVFMEQTGFTKDGLLHFQLIKLPLKRQVKHGLLRLFIKALRDKDRKECFHFQYICPSKEIKESSATARSFVMEGVQYVLFTFKFNEELSRQESALEMDNTDSWKSYLNLAYEPYMEFYPSVPLLPPQELDDRMSFLKIAGSSLRVKYANNVAIKLYSGENGTLTGKKFASFFNDGEDAFRFLDMLSIVGHVKAETAVSAVDGSVVEVEMNCMVKFDENDAISAVYCSQRDLSGRRRYEAIIGGSRAEMEFTFNQPFVGLAFLAPSHPIIRPKEEEPDSHFDILLNQILVMRANQAIVDIFGLDKTKFLLKPMMDFFKNATLARRVLKDLFVERTSSVEIYSSSKGKPDKLESVSIFRAKFDDLDRLSGILVASSKHSNGYKAHFSNKDT